VTRFTAVTALLALFAYATTQLTGDALNADREAWARSETRVTMPSPRVARLLSFGYNELAADLAWARTLVYYGDGIAHESTLQDVDQLLELVNAFDPRFRRPYLWGGYATVFRRRLATQKEYRASVVLLERGVAAFPQDWELAWLLGLRYYLDLKSDDPAEQRRFKEQGVDWISRAMRMPDAPPDLPGLAAALRTELGQKDRALRELREMILETSDEKARAKLIARYASLASEGEAEQLAQAKREFDAEWTAHLPYVPPALFTLIGPALPERSPAQLLEEPTLFIEDEVEQDHVEVQPEDL
jgi:hypothetical protein